VHFMDDQEDVTIHKQGKKTIVTTYIISNESNVYVLPRSN
jgi:hypothetical protein